MRVDFIHLATPLSRFPHLQSSLSLCLFALIFCRCRLVGARVGFHLNVVLRVCVFHSMFFVCLACE